MNQINNILNNSGEGFLTFRNDLLIEDQYSLECKKILVSKSQDNLFPRVTFPHDHNQQTFLEMILVDILGEKNIARRNKLFPLLPDETEISHKHISINYKLVNDIDLGEDKYKFMIVLTDISEKRNLENQIESERNILKMIVKAVVNYKDFVDCIKDYEDFCNEKIFGILESELPLEKIIFETFRNIHTFKGNFNQLDFVNIVDKLHNLESEISKLLDKVNSLTIQDFKDFLSQFQLKFWLEKDTNILTEILGPDFFKNDNVIPVSLEKLLMIEEKIKELFNVAEKTRLLKEIRKLRAKSFKDLLKSYPDYLLKLSEKLEKPIYPLKIEGDVILVDDSRYYNFCKSLVHVFRNIMDHGLEKTETRIEKDKDEYGKIICNVILKENHILITIADDGAGIDFDRIRMKAVEKNIISEENISKLSEDELINLIFRDDFSTKDKITEFSGRGMGLAAVLNELLLIDGKFNVKTVQGKGTEFNFLLPYFELE